MTLAKRRIKSLFDRHFSQVLVSGIALAGLIGLAMLFSRIPTTDMVYVPVDDIPAYYCLNNSSLVLKPIDVGKIPENCTTDWTDWNDTYTTKKLYSGEPVLKANLTKIPPSSTCRNNSTTFGFTVPAYLVLGSGLEKGDDVEAIFVPYNNSTLPDRNYTMFVMDVIAAKDNMSGEYILVVAMNGADAYSFINKSVDGKFRFIKRHEWP